MEPDEPLIDPIQSAAIEVSHLASKDSAKLARFLSELSRELADTNDRSAAEGLRMIHRALLQATNYQDRYHSLECREPASHFRDMLGPLLGEAWDEYRRTRPRPTRLL
jgi:hypothetical protein